jgi:hypothetical protein
MTTYIKYPTTSGNLAATVLSIAPAADLAVAKQIAITFHQSTKLCVWASGDFIVHRIRLKDIGLDAKVRLDQFLANSMTAVSYYTPGFVWITMGVSKRELTQAAEDIRAQDDHDVSYNQWIELRQEAIPKTANVGDVVGAGHVVGKVYNLRRSFIDNIVFIDCFAQSNGATPLVPAQIDFDYGEKKISLYYKTRNAAEAAYFDLLEAIPY